MKDFTQENLQVFFREKLRGAKVNFERARL